MPTYDHHADLAHTIAYPAFPRPRMPIDSRIAAVSEKSKEDGPTSSYLPATMGDRRLFQDTLLESGGKSRPRNPWAAVGSVAFQLLFLSALIVVPLFRTEVLPKPETLTMLAVPPSAGVSGATTFRVPTPARTSKSISIPNAMDKTQEAPPAPVDPMGGVVGGVPGGMVSSVPDVVLGEVLGNTHSVPVIAKTPEPNKRMRIASRVAEANLVHDVAPTYPAEAGRSRIEGIVVLLAVISKDGTVRDVRVESGLPVLAQAAIDAVKQWRYKPYLLNGEPTEVDAQITINFTLSRG